MRINHNVSAMNTYRQYSSNTKAANKSMEKLSSGYRSTARQTTRRAFDFREDEKPDLRTQPGDRNAETASPSSKRLKAR